MDLKKLNYYYNKFKFGEDNFHNLMRKRVHEILLVSTFYDAFIFEQDGRLSEQIYGEYMQLNLSTAPRVISVPTGEQALELLEHKRYDLVITMMRIGEISPFKLSRKIKEMYPDLPVLLLLNVQNDVGLIDKKSEEMKYIDNVFAWNGDSKIFLAMVKYIEDRWNVANDTELGLVRVILLVEDSIHYYSMFHPLLYAEIMKQTQRLISEELNDINKRQRMRGRPKVLLCHSFEEALEIYETYKEYIIAVISDVRYYFQGKIHPRAGLKLIRHLQMHNVACPLLLQSSEEQHRQSAAELGVHFLQKTSKTLLHDLRHFIVNNLGFGDFVFRNAAGHELNRATSLRDFESKLTEISDECLLYHSNRNDFSTWLTAHGEFMFAKRIRALTSSDFDSIDELRSFLVSTFREIRIRRNSGKIIHFTPESINTEERGIIRISEGSLGGKGRGIAFLNSLFVSMELEKQIPDVVVRIPKTYIIGTAEYDWFIEHNRIGDWITARSDTEIQRYFVESTLSPKLIGMLKVFIKRVRCPLAVRSSGLLEDSQSQPFAGIYETYMVPNVSEDNELRLRHLTNAIKLVYASVYMEGARNYIESIQYKLEEEKMAVILQETVGSDFDGYYYPHFSGVGQSYNFYPTGNLKNSDGIASIAIGLGKAVVEGDNIFRFCPRFPKTEIISQQELLGGAQKQFYAINTTCPQFNLLEDPDCTLTRLSLRKAEEHGSLRHLVSVWDYENNRMISDLAARGPRIANFADILQYSYFPLARVLQDILKIGEQAMGVPVEIEFAVDLTKDTPQKPLPTFYVLQIRPLTINTEEIYIDSDNINRDEVFLYTESGMGNGVISNIYDIVFLDPRKFDRTRTLEMKAEIAQINERLNKEGRQYILIGPGRWGSRDRFLGVPVQWHEIYKAKIIVEAGLKDFVVDASQGTHFFHNLVSMNVGYFTVPTQSATDFVDWDWLLAQSAYFKTEHMIHLRMDKPLVVKMDGRKGISFIYKSE
jgi:CheY-like chemotaxis protein